MSHCVNNCIPFSFVCIVKLSVLCQETYGNFADVLVVIAVNVVFIIIVIKIN